MFRKDAAYKPCEGRESRLRAGKTCCNACPKRFAPGATIGLRHLARIADPRELLASFLGDGQHLRRGLTARELQGVGGRRNQCNHEPRLTQDPDLVDLLGRAERHGQAGCGNLLEQVHRHDKSPSGLE
jgi:hypothetical protein